MDSTAPQGSRTEPGGGSFRGLDAAVELGKTEEVKAKVQASQAAAVTVLETFIGAHLAPPAELAGILAAAKGGAVLDSEQTAVVEEWIVKAADRSMEPGGGGLIEVTAVPAAFAALAAVSSVPAPRTPPNPFGRYAGFRVSKKNYDRGRAYRFKKNFARWVPYLILWDLTLRMVARVGRIRDRFTPGFVLDDTLGGLAAQEQKSGKTVVYIHPDRFRATVDSNPEKPEAIAYYLHTLACHELAHVEVGMGEGHGETYVSHREDLAQATAALLTPIAEAAARILKMKVPEPPAGRALRAAQKQVERCSSNLESLRAQLRSKKAPRAPRDPRRAWAERQVRDLEAQLRAQPVPNQKLIALLQEEREALITMLLED